MEQKKDGEVVISQFEEKEVDLEIIDSKFQVKPDELKQNTIPSPILLGGVETIGIKKIEPMDVEKYDLAHPVVPRGVELKMNRMIRLGYDIQKYDESKQAQEAVEYCAKLLNNSGGPIFIKRLGQAAYKFGDGFATLVPNVTETEILLCNLEHPVFFDVAKEKIVFEGSGPLALPKYLINPKTKKPEAYQQYAKGQQTNVTFNLQGQRQETIQRIPVGELIPANMVVHLVFDSMGDEVKGISIYQYLMLTIGYILNIEKAGAQTQYEFGFNRWKASTPFKTVEKMKEFGSYLQGLAKNSTIILPDGVTIDNIAPSGATQFAEYHRVFINLLAIRLGIPLPLLLQSGTETNKSTLDEQRKDMYEDMFADELVIERTLRYQLFESACKYKWGDKFDKIPYFKFREAPEDKDVRVSRELKKSLYVKNLVNSYQTLLDSGASQVADELLAVLSEYLKNKDEYKGLEPRV